MCFENAAEYLKADSSSQGNPSCRCSRSTLNFGQAVNTNFYSLVAKLHQYQTETHPMSNNRWLKCGFVLPEFNSTKALTLIPTM
jgi:hypothetical protein